MKLLHIVRPFRVTRDSQAAVAEAKEWKKWKGIDFPSFFQFFGESDLVGFLASSLSCS